MIYDKKLVFINNIPRSYDCTNSFIITFMTREPVSLPPIVSVELIQISDKTNIPFAPKARKIIEKVKEEEKRVVSEQAPPQLKQRKNQIVFLFLMKKRKKEIIKKKKSRGN